MTDHTRVAIVGTGFAGLGAGIALQQQGIPFTILERRSDVGGTWRDNVYPGCRCDVPSHLYSFSFAPNPDWSETFSPQPEIFEYLRRTAREHGVVDKIRFDTELRMASWDSTAQHWVLDTNRAGAAGSGQHSRLTADVLIMGNGPLAEPALPDIHGADTFQGTVFHSATWNTAHDLKGERVAVIGTGASAIQFVPQIQPQVEKLTLFQRTPPWVLPHPNRKISARMRTLYRRLPVLQRLVRAFIYWRQEAVVTGMLRNGGFLDKVEGLAKRHLAKQVPDAELRQKLTPDYKPGCKRLLLSNDYYPSLTQPNVDVVTEKIIEITPAGVVTADGVEHEVDTIIYGTGFKVTNNPIAHRICGTDARTLAEHWSEGGMQAYKGTAFPSFPNLFYLAGPNTGIGHTSLVVMIEAQLDYIVDALHLMEENGVGSIEVRRRACEEFNEQVQAKASKSVWNTGGCASWYLDEHGRNTTIWPDYTFRFKRLTRRFDASAYELVAPR